MRLITLGGTQDTSPLLTMEPSDADSKSTVRFVLPATLSNTFDFVSLLV